MLYVLAANILGPRPQPVPKKGSVRPQTYANLRQDLEQFGTVMRDVEADLPFDLMPFPADDAGDNDRLATLRSLGKALYFCVPRNDKLLSYWDTVADRLFKIRNSLNIQGIFRQLPLFEPPIDPALLARAAAAGLDVGAIVNGLNQPLPLVRFQLLVQKAAEIVPGGQVAGQQPALRDGEGRRRSDGHPARQARARGPGDGRAREVRPAAGGDQGEGGLAAVAGAGRAALHLLRAATGQEGRRDREGDSRVWSELDKDSLDKMKFAMKEPEVALREIEVDIAQDLGGVGRQDRQQLMKRRS